MEERKRLRLIEEMRAKRQSLSATKAQLKEAGEILDGKKGALLETEPALEAKRAVKAFTLHELGEGRPRGGGTEGKRNRAQVLGDGISPARRNDFVRFKEAWDSNMPAEHGERWPAVFAGWVHRLLHAHEEGDNTVFYVFMNNETRRCFA